MVELSDEVKQFIVKTVREEVIRFLPLTIVTKEDLRMAIDMLNKRFEDLQKYLDKRFESIDRRFETVGRRFEDLLNYMDRRFDAVDKRFEDMNRRFDGLVRLLQIMFVVLSLLIAVFGFLGTVM